MMQFSLSQSSSRLFLLVVILGSSCMIQSGFCFVERTATATATTIRNANAYTNASPSKTSLFTTSFDNLRKAFPQNADIVQAGGWYNLEQLSNDPKGALVEFVVDGLKGAASSVQQQQQQPVDKNEKLQALCLLLYGMGKGFTADAIDGEWDLVFTKQGSKSPSFQKLVGKTETAGRSKNFFDIKKMIFSGDVRFWKWGKVSTTVKYTPTSDAFSKTADGKIVVRRIVCQIINAFFKWWKLPGIPFPLPKNKGFLEVIYLDDDVRVTKGNRGGLFVHFRPEYLQKVLLDFNRFYLKPDFVGDDVNI